MKKIIAIISIVICMLASVTVYAANATREVEQTATGKLIEIKDKELKTLEDYRKS